MIRLAELQAPLPENHGFCPVGKYGKSLLLGARFCLALLYGFYPV